MNTPPFLMGATLAFWGWQSGLPAVGLVLGAILEGSRFVKFRWEFTDVDFTRIWTFCSVAVLAAGVYAFTANEGPSSFGGLFQDAGLAAQNRAGASSARTAIAVIRWFPLVFFLFMAAQAYGSRAGIPLAAISYLVRRRWRKARAAGGPVPEPRKVNISHSYWAGCLFAASAHTGGGNAYFWGLCVLLVWALWPGRSRRFGPVSTAFALGMTITLGYFTQLGIGQLARVFEDFNPQWFSGFSRQGFDPKQSHTAIGQIGRIKTSGKIVIRVGTKNGAAPPGHLREASYRSYHGGMWEAGGSKDDFAEVAPETNATTWVLLPRKTNADTVNLACWLDHGEALLPLPSGSGRLEDLPVFTLRENSAGAVLATGPGLVVFDARYGPGATIDSPPDEDEDAGEVPLREKPALDQVISELRLPPGLTREQKLQAIQAFFQVKFTYSLWQRGRDFPGTNETALGRFLLRTRSGHCEYFATATVLLLRELGIPARYAVGYAVHEGSGGKYVVRQRDAHAWCLAWNEATGSWQDFDTTPASWVAAEEERGSPGQFLSDGWSWLWFQFSRFRWGQTHLRQYLLWGIAPVLAFLLYQIIFRRGGRRRGALGAVEPSLAWPGLDSEFYQLEAQLGRQGLARQPVEPLSEWLRRVASDPAMSPMTGALRDLLQLHYRHRFDPRGLDEVEREELRGRTKTCLARVVADGRTIGSQTLAVGNKGPV